MSGLKKKQLEERKSKKDRIQNVLRMPGWADIEAVIKSVFTENLEKILLKDDPTARGAISAIKQICESISDDIDWGNAAMEEYRKKYIGKLSIGE